MKQLGGVDASFLYLETAETPMHIGSLSLFELPEGYDGNFYEDFGLAAQTKKAGSTAKVMTVRARSRSRNEVSN